MPKDLRTFIDEITHLDPQQILSVQDEMSCSFCKIGN
jgi:hypothetical protein